MAELSRENEAALRRAGWIPVGEILDSGGVRPLGEGGGAFAYKVVSEKAASRLVKPLLGPSDRQSVKRVSIELAEVLGDFIEGVNPPVAVAKVAKTDTVRMHQEIAVLKEVVHPHLIRLLDHDSTEPPSWYVMPFYRYGSLDKMTESLQGDFITVFRNLLPIAEAVAAMHKAKFVHRDIKPGNIFVRSHGDWVLADPGIAFHEDSTSHTETRICSRDWFPRWYDDKFGHSFEADLYMLSAVAIWLLAGEKALAPAWLKEEKFNLAERFADKRGAEQAFDLLRKQFVETPQDMAYKTADEFCAELKAVLSAVERGPSQSHVFSWVANHPSERVEGSQSSLGDIAVLLPQKTHRLRARVHQAQGGKLNLAFLAWPDGAESPTQVASSQFGKKGWTPELCARFDPPLDPGWHRIGIALQGDATIDGLVIYAE